MHLLGRLWTGHSIRGKDTMFLDETKAKFFGLFAGNSEIYACVIIFRGEDGFACFYDRQHFFIPVIEEIIFDDGKIEIMDQILYLISSIFDSDCKSTLMRFVC